MVLVDILIFFWYSCIELVGSMEMEDHGTTWVMEEKLFEAGLQEGHVTPEHALKNPSLHDGL